VLGEPVTAVLKGEALIYEPIAVIVDQVTALRRRLGAIALASPLTSTDEDPLTAPMLIAELTDRSGDALVDETVAVLIEAVTALLLRGLSVTADPALPRLTALLS
jgi:hypothetical protein